MRIKANMSLMIAGILTLGFVAIANSQQGTNALPKVGFILPSGSADTPGPPIVEAFRQGLRDLGYVDGKNIVIERRYPEGRLERMAPFVHEFIEQKVDVILGTSNVVIQAARKATKTIPIVMISSVDPVEAGYVESFARPGGNVTGIAWLLRAISAKRVELLKDVLPKLSKLGILWDGAGPGPKRALAEYQAAARDFKLNLRSLEVRGPSPDLMGAFQTAQTEQLNAVIVVANPLIAEHRKNVFELAVKSRLPSMTEGAHYVESGGLVSYGANYEDIYRRAAEYVVDILKGHKPADLPVKLATKFEIIVNLKTAKQIGVTIPQHVLVQADKVIK